MIPIRTSEKKAGKKVTLAHHANGVLVFVLHSKTFYQALIIRVSMFIWVISLCFICVTCLYVLCIVNGILIAFCLLGNSNK